MLRKPATWNDMKSLRSMIVCNADDAKSTRSRVKHIAAVAVGTDSRAAAGITQWLGAGRVRHLEVKDLWI